RAAAARAGDRARDGPPRPGAHRARAVPGAHGRRSRRALPPRSGPRTHRLRGARLPRGVIHGGVLARAFAIYRRYFAAVLATAAIALLPADLLASGAVRLGTVALGGTAADPRGSESKGENLRQTPPGEPRADA